MALLPAVELTTDEQKASYGFGLQFGDQLRRNSFEGLELDAVLAGIQHWYNQQEAALDDGQINASYQVIQARKQARDAELAGKRQQLADIFLEANAAREGVTTTDSGLQYEVLESGDGARPGRHRAGLCRGRYCHRRHRSGRLFHRRQAGRRRLGVRGRARRRGVVPRGGVPGVARRLPRRPGPAGRGNGCNGTGRRWTAVTGIPPPGSGSPA